MQCRLCGNPVLLIELPNRARCEYHSYCGKACSIFDAGFFHPGLQTAAAARVDLWTN